MKIGTIASHSALNIISGAKAEGFHTQLYCRPNRIPFYKSFGLEDSIVEVDSFEQILEMDLSDVVLIPHGSFVTYIGAQKLLNSDLRLFGNKELLRWEENRKLKSKLMVEAGFTVPKEYSSLGEINGPVIAKTHGAAGGRGYFVAKNTDWAKEKMNPSVDYILQEYIVGTKVFVTYFNSLTRNRTEVFSADIRYETDIDSSLRFNDEPTFTVIGNLPLVLRESILAEYFDMGVAFVEAFHRLCNQKIPGPFCIETVIDREQQIYTFEFSGRIVAGTNVWIPSSPYSYLQHGEPVWMGRRIAIEIRELIEQNQLDEVLK
ncbi:MAG: formate--phosphoribosylaminoimidazolecarboxamide ligase [Candidatus Thorarchaeota archaeon SMTZ1-45]|nr:MAG: hypothetical protein AM325_03355 [Candidatus Thorarchaeota archaeon SMTZ1-45]